jgi:hypothetical protein
MSGPHDPGQQVLDWVFTRMMIDEEWSVREPRSFIWWGHQLAQRVWAEPARQDDEFALCRLHAECDLLRNVPGTPDTVATLASLNGIASLSALVWDRDRGTVKLHCSTVVHAETTDWMGELFTHAVAIQAADAYHRVVFPYGQALGGEPDTSPHPASGPRNEPDDMLGVLQDLYLPEGKKPSPFTGREFQATANLRSEKGWGMANASDTGMTGEIPYFGDLPVAMQILGYTGQRPGGIRQRLGGLFGREKPAPQGVQTALLTSSSREPHPELGSGVLIRLHLPFEATADTSVALAWAERQQWTNCYGFGAWCIGHMSVTHVTFVPAAAYRPGIFQALAVTEVGRVQWAQQVLGHNLAS